MFSCERESVVTADSVYPTLSDGTAGTSSAQSGVLDGDVRQKVRKQTVRPGGDSASFYLTFAAREATC